MNNFTKLYKICKSSNTSFISVFIRLVWYKIIYKKNLLLHPRVIINYPKNLIVKGNLEVGLGYIGFTHKKDFTLLNIRGKLRIAKNYNIGRGCRIDIDKGGEVNIGEGGYMNPFTKLIIKHKLTIGNHCNISWDCQFLDDDFHTIKYDGQNITTKEITIGNNVWIGCGVKIYKGTYIADGCVIAANAIVRGEFKVPNSLIAGCPAKLIKENVSWE